MPRIDGHQFTRSTGNTRNEILLGGSTPSRRVARAAAGRWPLTSRRLEVGREEHGGGGRIRTLGALRHSGFQNRRIRPLCHASGEREVKGTDGSGPRGERRRGGEAPD